MTVAELVDRLLGDGSLTGASLSRPRAVDPDVARRVTVDQVQLRAGARWRVRRHYATRTTDDNLDAGALARLRPRSGRTTARRCSTSPRPTGRCSPAVAASPGSC